MMMIPGKLYRLRQPDGTLDRTYLLVYKTCEIHGFPVGTIFLFVKQLSNFQKNSVLLLGPTGKNYTFPEDLFDQYFVEGKNSP